MKKVLILCSCCVLLTMTMCATAWSSSLLSTYVHDYGTDQWDPAGTDPLDNDYVLVKDSSAGRFSDSFDFSDLSYESIERFELKLTYTNANNTFLGMSTEKWYARPGGAGDREHFEPYEPFRLTRSGSGEIVFDIYDESLDNDKFSKMVEAENFFFLFAEETWELFSHDEFRLYDATLKIYGEASIVQDTPASTIPEPATMVLFGIGLLGLAGVSRRKQ